MFAILVSCGGAKKTNIEKGRVVAEIEMTQSAIETMEIVKADLYEQVGKYIALKALRSDYAYVARIAETEGALDMTLLKTKTAERPKPGGEDTTLYLTAWIDDTTLPSRIDRIVELTKAVGETKDGAYRGSGRGRATVTDTESKAQTEAVAAALLNAKAQLAQTLTASLGVDDPETLGFFVSQAEVVEKNVFAQGESVEAFVIIELHRAEKRED